MREENKIKIDLLRHGETTAGSCFLGSTDVLLSESGWQQMALAIQPGHYQRIISSPLKRCALFSKKLAEKNNLPIVFEDDFREIHFGDWEEKTIKEVWESEEALLSNFWNDPLKHTPPNAEKLLDFQTRVNATFDRIKQQYEGEHILLVVHGGVIRQIIASILSVPFKTAQQFNIDYAGLSRIECYEESTSLAFINQQIEITET